MIFDYPDQRFARRHGPAGYARYESFRPWLRDEFMFRCVYCLKRETWGQVTGEFDLDHFAPQSVHPDQALDYENLVYACRRCNSVKTDKSIPDPFLELHSGNLNCQVDGRLLASSAEAARLIRILDLNSPRLLEWRIMWLRLAALARRHDESLYQLLVGLPRDLPNLKRLRPPRNHRPQGIDESWATKASREN